jgi:pyruvate,orthophosphate dikinase
MPLLLAVRSGAAVSMPGIMDTVLNVGINDDIVQVMAEQSHNARWAYDTYRRFIQMYGTVVEKVDGRKYELIIERAMDRENYSVETQMTADDYKRIVEEFKAITHFPQDAWEQLSMTVEAVFDSWRSPRALKYRAMNEIDRNLRVIGTAIVVQTMVHGNMNLHSGTGVLFSRNPDSGEGSGDPEALYGEFLIHAAGSDIGSGVRTPRPLSEAIEEHPEAIQHLKQYAKQLEEKYKDAQEIEFTIENGRLYLLQCSPAKRTARAAVNIAVAMAKEKLLTEREAIMRVDPLLMECFQHPVVDDNYGQKLHFIFTLLFRLIFEL